MRGSYTTPPNHMGLAQHPKKGWGRGFSQQQDYNEENNEDEAYAKRVLGNHRGPTRDNGRDIRSRGTIR